MDPKKPSKRNRKEATKTGPYFHRRRDVGSAALTAATSDAGTTSAGPPISNYRVTHIRPPPLHSGDLTIRSLLVDSTAFDRYRLFQNREFIVMYTLSRSFLQSLHIDKLVGLIDAQPMFDFIVKYSAPINPGMVAQFFANLRYAHGTDGDVITSRVNNMPISLTYQKINEIF